MPTNVQEIYYIYEPIDDLMNQNLKDKCPGLVIKKILFLSLTLLLLVSGWLLGSIMEMIQSHPLPVDYSETKIGNFIRLSNFNFRRGDLFRDSHIKNDPQKCLPKRNYFLHRRGYQ